MDREGMGEWFVSSKETGSCLVGGDSFGPGGRPGLRRLTYGIVNGLAIFEGDICLGNADEMKGDNPLSDELSGIQLDPMSMEDDQVNGFGCAHSRPLGRMAAPVKRRFRWDRGVIPYDIAGDVPDTLRETITNAIRHWTENTFIEFLKIPPGSEKEHSNVLRFVAGDYCMSYVGKRRRIQELMLNPGYSKVYGAAIHEIGHAIGLWHEQSRRDRGDYVEIHYENIVDGMEHNFDQYATDEGDDYGEYDFDSIMHYSAFAFTKNNRPTIVPKVKDVDIGQRKGLSQRDVEGANFLYGKQHE